MSTDIFRMQPTTIGFLLAAALTLIAACATPTRQSVIKGSSEFYDRGTIISTATGEAVTFEQLVADLTTVQIVYVGESHTNEAHHDVQRQLIEALNAQHKSLAVGMEMFDRSYQPVLDEWSNGGMDLEEFLRKTHWYANWRFNDALYAPILEAIKTSRIRLVALNLPFHIPRKIRVGGIDHLHPDEKKYIPAEIDTSNTRHRAYVENVFNQHNFGGRTRFEDFYLAQCVWDDGMAEAIAENLNGRPMVVLVGNGHIQYKYGIPDRAFKRTGAEFRTVYPVSSGMQVDADIADYVWVTE